MENYFYFGEETVETTGEAAMFPLSSFLGMTPSGSDSVKLFFKSRNGALTDDNIEFTFTGTTKNFMSIMVKFLQRNQKNPFIVICDREGTSNEDLPRQLAGIVSRAIITTEA
jgi:hypothetical protein|tara:strand:- start:684 stop:1019 length:336 start_codon:yes stop_codon:yes gene_type:complete